MLKPFLMKLTDNNAATNNASPEAINTAPHPPNAGTDLDSAATTAVNKTSVIPWLDGLEYPFAKGDIIKKSFDIKAAVERCLA